MRQYGEIAAEANLLHLRTGTYLIGVEVGFRFAGDAQQVSKLVCVSGGVLRRKQVAVQGEFTEERPHAAGDAYHRNQGGEQHCFYAG